MDIYDDIVVFGGIEDAQPTGTEDINFFDRSPVFQQIKACVDAVPGAKGALMADKHLGYRMPIGGVVAYPGYISPTGVGYDIGCFSGDTLVPLLNGTQKSLKDLVNAGEFYVYSIDENNKIVPGKAVSVMTRKSAELIEIQISGGAFIRCTPDHLFMMRDGTYKQAKDLCFNNSLMPLYRTYQERDGYEMLHQPNDHHVLTHTMVSEHFNGLTPKGSLTHHQDENHFNNDPSNLVTWTKFKHQSYHRTKNPLTITDEFKQKRMATLRRDGFFSEDLRGKKQQVGIQNLRTSQAAHPEAFAKNYQAAGARGRVYLAKYNVSPRTCGVCDQALKNASAYSWHMKKEHNNHKVVGVRQLGIQENVYCLQVEQYHNFALAAGVFVHNCGNMAMKTKLKSTDIANRTKLAAEIREKIQFGIGKVSDIGKGALEILNINWFNDLMQPLKQLAASQLGTVGGGNHYVDLLVDQDDTVWIACHFGSRGFGHKIAKQVNEHLGLKDVMMGEPGLLKEGTALFDTYLEAMEAAGDYAALGRQLVMTTVLDILGTTPTQIVENHHNFAWKEMVDGQQMWVIRKGATPINTIGKVFIGGSMAGVSTIAQGYPDAMMNLALGSAPHGSGRIMSRGNAKRTIKREDMDAKLVEEDVILSGGDVDESPFVYRDLMDVISEHAVYITPLEWLRPILVVMAGKADNDRDPYKD